MPDNDVPAPVPAPIPTPPTAIENAQSAAAAASAATPASVPSPVPAPTPVSKCPKCEPQREVTAITMKRKHIHLRGDDKYGHWWTELGGGESYGWWPAEPLSTRKTLMGVQGDLNGQAMFGGTPTTDPHDGDPAEEQFHPKVSVCDKRTDDEIKDCIRGYAKSYSGSWRWTFGSGQNCHSFQEGMMTHCGLSE